MGVIGKVNQSKKNVLKTSKTLAKQYGVSPRTVERAGQLAELLAKSAPEVIEAVMQGKTKNAEKENRNMGC